LEEERTVQETASTQDTQKRRTPVADQPAGGDLAAKSESGASDPVKPDLARTQADARTQAFARTQADATAPAMVATMQPVASAVTSSSSVAASPSKAGLKPSRRLRVASALSDQASGFMGDAPFCDGCGHITVRNGSCYRCLNCGHSMGCS
jgi:ribonucleoside-diphosphate reductase alpha chain